MQILVDKFNKPQNSINQQPFTPSTKKEFGTLAELPTSKEERLLIVQIFQNLLSLFKIYIYNFSTYLLCRGTQLVESIFESETKLL